MTPYMTRYVGSYNWADASEKMAQLSVHFEVDGKRYVVSDTVEPDSKYDFDPGDIDIVDAVDMLEKSVERYLINTGREESRSKIAVFRANQSALRKEWLLDQATRHQKRAAIEHKRFRNFMAEFDDECEQEAERISEAA